MTDLWIYGSSAELLIWNRNVCISCRCLNMTFGIFSYRKLVQFLRVRFVCGRFEICFFGESDLILVQPAKPAAVAVIKHTAALNHFSVAKVLMEDFFLKVPFFYYILLIWGYSESLSEMIISGFLFLLFFVANLATQHELQMNQQLKRLCRCMFYHFKNIYSQVRSLYNIYKMKNNERPCKGPCMFI